MPNGYPSTPANETIKAATGTVGRLVDRLIQQNPHAQVRFAVSGPILVDDGLVLLSVFSDDEGIVWVDVGPE